MSSLKRPLAKTPVSVNDLFSADSDEEDRKPSKKASVQPKAVPAAAPPPPVSSPTTAGRSEELDPETKEVCDKLADFVAKNGRQFEQLTREKNPGNTPFRFLHDKSSTAYRYYESKLSVLEASLRGSGTAATGHTATPSTSYAPHSSSSCSRPPPASSSYRPPHQQLRSGPSAPSYPKRVLTKEEELEEEKYARLAAHKGDSIAAMEAYMAATAKREAERQAREDEEERQRKLATPLLNETSFDRRKVVAVYRSDGTRGHHMGDYIPEEELAKFLSKQGDAYGLKKAAELEERAKIGADNIGHKLLQKMGWKEGEALGGSQKGITAPVQAAGVTNDNLGLGATGHGEVTKDDDPYEAYRKRMMLGYKFRPNPLGNPRKAYY